jgi:hypothetical protein
LELAPVPALGPAVAAAAPAAETIIALMPAAELMPCMPFALAPLTPALPPVGVEEFAQPALTMKQALAIHAAPATRAFVRKVMRAPLIGGCLP